MVACHDKVKRIVILRTGLSILWENKYCSVTNIKSLKQHRVRGFKDVVESHYEDANDKARRPVDLYL